MIVRQILKAKFDDGVVTVQPGMTVARVVEILATRRIGAVVVSSDGKRPEGILTERDIVRDLSRRGPNSIYEKVRDVMTTPVVTCTAACEADEVMQKMTDGKFRHMPVMAGEEMVGLISIRDVVKARLSEVAMERNALEGMIRGY